MASAKTATRLGITRHKVPSTAPKTYPNISHIRQNPDIYARDAALKKYRKAEEGPWKVVQLFDERKASQIKNRSLREGANANRTILRHAKTFSGRERSKEEQDDESTESLHQKAKDFKQQLAAVEAEEESLTKRIHSIASDIPNLIHPETRPLTEPRVCGNINEIARNAFSSSDRRWRNHVHLGAQFDLIDFASAATTTGWGWYYLDNEGAELEYALVNYALQVAQKHGFKVSVPPSLVYSHVGHACGFKPRDQNNEQQVYAIEQHEEDASSDKPTLSLAGTAEIPFAAKKANTIFHEADLPHRIVGSSRCFRAEAGARGADTKGLFRVHEFTKVEMFTWGMKDDSIKLFEQMLAVQEEILTSLGLCCRILEMPPSDLGASAHRKRDIEVYFPSRSDINEGWGEVTSTSMCTDYQTRRLSTRVRLEDGSLDFPETVNGTAMAVPRVLASLLEYGWDEEKDSIRIPECLRYWMGKDSIHKKRTGSLKEP